MPSLWEILKILIEFLPQIFILYFVLTLIEKSGLLSVLARLFHVPVSTLLPVCLSFECTTMAICTCREQPNRQRLVYCLSFLPCTAQLPMFTFLLLTILGFPFWVLILLYLFCILIGVAVMLMIPATKSNNVLPTTSLQMPNLWQCLLETIKQTLFFAKKILIAFAISAFVIVILARFSFKFHYVNNPEQSILFSICGLLSPIFAPIGLDNPAIICALLFGIIAKEAAVSVLLFFPKIISGLTTPAILALVIFFALYPKCIAAQTAVNTHCGRKTGVKVFLTNLLVAYALSFVVYTVCGIII